MTPAPKITVGQKLWFVPANECHGEPRYIEVKKVGRKWAILKTLDFYRETRCDVKNREVERGGIHIGRCYLSPEEAEELKLEKERAREVYETERKEWDRLRFLVGWSKPAHLSAADIRRCIDMIKPPKAEGESNG